MEVRFLYRVELTKVQKLPKVLYGPELYVTLGVPRPVTFDWHRDHDEVLGNPLELPDSFTRISCVFQNVPYHRTVKLTVLERAQILDVSLDESTSRTILSEPLPPSFRFELDIKRDDFDDSR